MRKLIQQQDARTAGKCCVEVELLQHLAAIGDSGARQDRQIADRGLGLGAAMRLDDADHHILAARGAAAPLRQHLPGLADTGCGAEEHLQPAATLALGQSEQGIGIGSGGFLGHRRRP